MSSQVLVGFESVTSFHMKYVNPLSHFLQISHQYRIPNITPENFRFKTCFNALHTKMYTIAIMCFERVRELITVKFLKII